jgi:hypothetical protein
LAEKYGLRLWEQVWTSGAGWLKQNMDTELVLMLCEAVDERMRLRAMLAQDQTLRGVNVERCVK